MKICQDCALHYVKVRNRNEYTYIYTLPGRKYSSTTKNPCTDCAMYRLNIQLGPKIGIETCRSQKFVVLALTLEIFF